MGTAGILSQSPRPYNARMLSLPILYSFRRCPYAIRARMVLAYAGVSVEHREVLLARKPAAMLEVSRKATVPVLVLPDGRVIDESLDVMRWALAQHDPKNWRAAANTPLADSLIANNDGPFKYWLDRYKYADRYPDRSPQEYLSEAMPYLATLEQTLGASRFLAGDSPGFLDVAIFPFVRQFAAVDEASFRALGYAQLLRWLEGLLQSALFLQVMEKHPLWEPPTTETAR